MGLPLTCLSGRHPPAHQLGPGAHVGAVGHGAVAAAAVEADGLRAEGEVDGLSEHQEGDVVDEGGPLVGRVHHHVAHGHVLQPVRAEGRRAVRVLAGVELAHAHARPAVSHRSRQGPRNTVLPSVVPRLSSNQSQPHSMVYCNSDSALYFIFCIMQQPTQYIFRITRVVRKVSFPIFSRKNVCFICNDQYTIGKLRL